MKLRLSQQGALWLVVHGRKLGDGAGHQAVVQTAIRVQLIKRDIGGKKICFRGGVSVGQVSRAAGIAALEVDHTTGNDQHNDTDTDEQWES